MGGEEKNLFSYKTKGHNLSNNVVMSSIEIDLKI